MPFFDFDRSYLLAPHIKQIDLRCVRIRCFQRGNILLSFLFLLAGNRGHFTLPGPIIELIAVPRLQTDLTIGIGGERNREIDYIPKASTNAVE